MWGLEAFGILKTIELRCPTMLLTQSFPEEELSFLQSRNNPPDLGGGNACKSSLQPLPACCSKVRLSPSIRKELQIVRQRLQTSDEPLLSKIICYLQASCFAILKVKQLGEDAPTNWSFITYTGLIKALVQRDTGWWRRCSVAEHGELTSDDPCVRELLHPIEEFYQTYVLREW
jgi:hypothetical protein